MNTKSNNSNIIKEVNNLKRMSSFGIKHHNNFTIINVMITENGKLYYLDNDDKRCSVSSLINRIKGLQTSRWLNHLYFRNSIGKEINFKDYISRKYNLKFT